MTTETMEDLVERASALGREHGTAGGSWVELDGSQDAGGCIQLDEDGDPMWWDAYGPASGPLSGEWADGMTPQRLLDELDQNATEDEVGETLTSELCDAYEQAYYDAWREEVLRMVRYQVGES